MTAEPEPACHTCGGALGNSPSDFWCSDPCQARWHAERSVPLVGYREPRSCDFRGVGAYAAAARSLRPW
ncbi:hypothetical protein JOF36_005954 [Pseudonocardia parietis]|uniref:DUF2116 family Zn-ribbon domain-containing protein n=1 Tax=Pseudonocardia parietis TaxID=570936 RepID=A0ABS4W225_9PSEU|nr:hypothetical protein [Pseudonocardia parietis]